MIATHKTGWPCLDQLLWLLSGWICHLDPCLPLLVLAMCEAVVVLLSHLQWKSLVFPNNTESLGSLARDWDGEHDGVLPNASGSSEPFQMLVV